MPNPLLNKQKNVSKRGMTQEDRPQAIDPVPEHYAGVNMPYRGTETHGVEPTNDPEQTPEFDGTIPAKFTVEDAPPAPVPVKIVTEGKNEINDWQVQRGYASNGASRILGRNINRTAARIRNLGTVTVWVGPNESVAAFTGYPIPVGAEFALAKAVTAVWAISDDGTQQPIAVMEEFVSNGR